MDYRAELRLRDRDGGDGRVYLRFSPPSDFTAALSDTIEPFQSAIEGITDSVVIRVLGTWSARVNDGVTPADGIDMQSKVLFVLDTGHGCVGVQFPAPNPGIFVDTGPWAGILVRDDVVADVITFFNTVIRLSDPLDPSTPAAFYQGAGARIS